MNRVMFSISKWGFCCALIVGFSVAQVQADIITPVAANATSQFGLGSDASDLVSGSGLSGADASATHDADEANMWISGCADAGVPGGLATETCEENGFAVGPVSEQIVEIVFDSGYEVDSVLVWQYNRADILTRGPTDVNVLVSPSLDGDFTDVGNFALAVGSGAAESAQVLSIDGVAGSEAVRRIRLQINANGGDAYVGLSEIRADGVALPANVIPGDADGSGDTDFNDALATLGYIFLGSPADIAGCTDGGSTTAILDWNGDGEGDMSDAVASLRSEFLGGPGHVQGDSCLFYFSCNQTCP